MRTSLASVARLFNAHNFTSILRSTLQWLQNHVKGKTVSQDEGIGRAESMDRPDESSDTAQSSSGEHRTSKKRKLDGTEVTGSRVAISTATGVLGEVYLAILDTLDQLEALIKDPEQSQGFAVEHMKSCLRNSPEDAAHVLGSSFFLANRIILAPQFQKKLPTNNLQKQLADTGYRSCIFPAIDLWKQRSLVAQDSSPASNVHDLRNFD